VPVIPSGYGPSKDEMEWQKMELREAIPDEILSEPIIRQKMRDNVLLKDIRLSIRKAGKGTAGVGRTMKDYR
jgi:hypothetical protein